MTVQKIVLWLMSTLTVLVLLFGYHTSTSPDAVGAGSSQVTPVTGAAAPGSSAASGTTAAAAESTVTGDPASTRYGPVQVQITVADGAITAVSVIDYPDSDDKDQRINARALPILVQETLDAQSSDIDMVSGATYTSDGYVESLQSALDQAGL